jgi:hypothetical protein
MQTDLILFFPQLLLLVGAEVVLQEWGETERPVVLEGVVVHNHLPVL